MKKKKTPARKTAAKKLPLKKAAKKKITPRRKPAQKPKAPNRRDTARKASPKSALRPPLAMMAGVPPMGAEEPLPEFRDRLERSIERFCRTRGWTDVLIDFDVFKAGTIKQLSFHQRSSLPGQIRTEAERLATDMQTYLHLFRYDATGGVVLEIARIAEDEGRAMQALLDAAVSGYVKRP